MLTARVRPARNILACWRFHLLVILSLLVLLPATIFYAALTSDHGEFLRRLAVCSWGWRVGRPVSIGAVALDWRGRLTVRDLRIADRVPGAPPFVAFQRLEVTFDPLQLLATPLGALRRIALEQPVVRAARDAHGTWSFDDILRALKLRKPSSDQFHGELAISDGEVYYQDALGLPPHPAPLAEHLLHVNLQAQASRADFTPLHLTAVSAPGHFAALSPRLRVKADSATCQLDIGQVDLGFVQKFLDPQTPFTLYGGHAAPRAELAIAPDTRTGALDAAMTLIADVTQVDGLLRLHTLTAPFHVNSGQFRLAQSEIELVDFHGLLAGFPSSAMAPSVISTIPSSACGCRSPRRMWSS